MGRKSERWAERLLDAAAGHASWETVGQELRDALRTPLAGVQLRDGLGRPVEVALALDVEPAALRAYAEEFHAEDPHGPAMLGRSAYEVVDSDSLLPRRELMRSRYYQEWMVPSGMDRFLGFWAPFEDGTIGAAFLRAPGSEPFGTAERALVASLARPLARAVEVQARLRRAEAPRAGSASSGARPQHATTSALADVVATGLAVVDRAGVVLEANAAARELLRSLDRIPAHTPVELRAIALRNGGFFVQLEERLISVVVRPLPPMLARLPRAHALVFLSDPTHRPSGLRALLRAFYGLTIAESKVLELAIEGLDAEGIATRLGIAKGTVHVHFRRLFQKVGVRRAAELVATVSRVLPQWR
jgi:DNA-binding CsgD family transcriptional regulator